MKKIVLMVFVLSAFSGIVAAQDVKFTRRGVDEFTGEYVVETYNLNLTKKAGNTIWVGFSYHDNSFSLNLAFHQYSPFHIAPGSKLYFKFADGEVKSLASYGEADYAYHQTPGVIPYTAVAVYPADLELIEYFALHEVVMVRVESSIGSVDKSLKPKTSILFANYASAFLDALP